MTTNDRSPADAHFDRWGDTWTPGKKDRYGLVWAVRGLIGTPVGALAGMATAVATGLRVPQGIVTAWRAIVRERRIGPNLKVALCIVTPVGVPIAAFQVSALGVVLGAARGFWQGPIHGAVASLIDSYQVYQWIGELVSHVWNEPKPEPLKEGEKPFDIKPLLGVWSGVVGVASSVALGVAHGAVYVQEFPRLVFKTYKRLWGGRTGFVAFFLDVASVTVVPVCLVLGLPVFAAYGAAWGLGRGMRTTYTTGTGAVAGRLREAYEKSLAQWQKYLGKELEQDIDQEINAARP